MEPRPNSIAYIECSIPPRVTIAEYRRDRAIARRRASRRFRVMRRAHLTG